jgi:ABC-type lipoprotein export system ATPase subunit
MFESLELQNVMPDSLPEAFGQDSEVWNCRLHISRGEQVMISAASGKGKSTLISILYGLKGNYKGTCLINGKDVRKFSAATWSGWRSSGLSIVFQDLRLFPQLSVEDNLRLKGKLSDKEFSMEEAEEMCRQLGVDRYMKRPCGTLSFGERQRVAIVRSLIQPAGLVLMDEPFSHLDRSNTEKALDLIRKKTASRGAALLITSLGQDFGWKYDRMVQL